MSDRHIDEQLLRRALRLDADEAPPRLDPTLIAAAARAGRDRSRDIALVGIVAFLGGWLSAEVSRLAIAGLTSIVGVDPLALAIQTVASAAVKVAPLFELATSPAIPLAIGAAAILAFIFEQRGSPREDGRPRIA